MIEQDHIGMTAETIGHDLLAACLDEFKAMPDVWQKLNQEQQDEVIERVRKRVEENVRQAVGLIAAQGGIVVAADLESISIKDGIKATVKIHRGNQPSAKQALFESANRPCMLVVTDATDFMHGADDVKGDPDQRGLGLDDEGGCDDPLYEEAVMWVRSTGRPSISLVQRHLQLGYNRAARLIEAMELAGVVSKMQSNGQRTVIKGA